jgi:serine protease Do
MMRRLCHLALAMLAMLAAVPATAEQADIDAAARSVVRIVLIQVDGDGAMLIGHGTGFAVSRNRILTNHHVIAEALDYDDVAVGVIRAEGSDRWGARIVAVAPRIDLALLELADSGSLEPMTLFSGPPQDGAQVFAIGYPGAVDLGQGLVADDMIRPMSPVKSPGTLTAGRSAKDFATVLHTAAIGSGNSGGPLVDSCGRVLGVNSYGASTGRIDAEFFFAVAMSEVMRFLTRAEVKPAVTAEACRSLEELEAAEREKAEAAQAREQRASARREREYRDALDAARLDVMSERENGMALALVCLLLAVVGGGAAFHFGQQEGRARQARIAGGLGVLFLIVAAAAWFSRPPVSDAEKRARDMTGGGSPAAPDEKEPLSGKLVCVIDTDRSRITVSATSDVPFTWDPGGCVNGRTQYGLGSDGWSRILVPNQDQTVTVAAFDPATRIYQTRRYLLDLETMNALREKRAAITPPSCGAGEDAARRFGGQQSGLAALLPQRPNELLVYTCSQRD